MASKFRQLGSNGPHVPALGLGLMGMSMMVYGKVLSDEECFALLDRAYEVGERFWDTADLYGRGEEIIGLWFKRTGKRDDIFLASKAGFVKGSKTYDVDSSGPYIKKACQESLNNLGLDYIDLYYMHSANPETPIEETMRALVELQNEGKIKHIGLSSVSSATLRRASKIGHIAACQAEYSVLSREIEGPAGTDLLATCRETGCAVVVAMPMGRGILTSSFANGTLLAEDKDGRQMMMPRFQAGNMGANVEIVTQFKALADKKECSVTQLALAWLLKQGSDIIPIPGTKQIKYMEENWASLDVSLSDEEEKEIRDFSKNLALSGNSVPPGFEDHMFRNTKEEST